MLCHVCYVCCMLCVIYDLCCVMYVVCCVMYVVCCMSCMLYVVCHVCCTLGHFVTGEFIEVVRVETSTPSDLLCYLRKVNVQV